VTYRPAVNWNAGMSADSDDLHDADMLATRRLNKPDVAHYNGEIEPIDYMRAIMSREEFRGFLRGNVIKYISRFHRKGGVEDLRKAQVYQQWLLEHETNAPTD